MSKMTLKATAKKLLEANPPLKEILDNAPDNGQYKSIEPHISGEVLRWVGKKVGTFVPKRDFIWALIDAHSGTGVDLVLPD